MGGIKVDDLVIDLVIVSVLIFFFEDIFIFFDVCFVVEVGLLGEIWVVSRIE